DKMHLGGAGIGEADVDPACDQSPHQTFRTVHSPAPVGDSSFFNGIRSIIPEAVRQRGREGSTGVPSAWLLSPVHTERNFNRTFRNSPPLLAKTPAIWPA